MENMTHIFPRLASAESDLDRQLEKLIEKMVAETATLIERAEYQELAAQRARLMRPILPENLEKIRMSRMTLRKYA